MSIDLNSDRKSILRRSGGREGDCEVNGGGPGRAAGSSDMDEVWQIWRDLVMDGFEGDESNSIQIADSNCFKTVGCVLNGRGVGYDLGCWVWRDLLRRPKRSEMH